MSTHKKNPRHEERREERIEKGHRERNKQRKASQSLRRISKFAHQFDNVDEYADDWDELYEDD